MYASAIPGVTFLRDRQLPASVTVAEFHTTGEFSSDSARRVLLELPEDHQICYADPDRQLVGRELTYVFIRRFGNRFFTQAVAHGRDLDWHEEPFEGVLVSFASSRLVAHPLSSFASFEISLIPDHQRREHLASDDKA